MIIFPKIIKILRTATSHKEEPIQKALDSSIDQYAEKLIQVITDLCKNLSPYTILNSWIVFQIKNIFTKSDKTIVVRDSEQTDSTISIDSVLDNKNR